MIEKHHQYLAKTLMGEEGTYDYHVQRCHDVFSHIITELEPYLEGLIAESGMSMKVFIQRMKQTIIFHDLGKLSPLFQGMLSKKIEGKIVDRMDHFRHEVLSTLYLYPLLEDGSLNFPFFLMAILGHHKSIDKQLQCFERERKRESWPLLSTEDIAYIHHYYGDYLDGKITDKKQKDCQRLLRIVSHRLISRTYLNKGLDIESLRLLYSITQGILCYCDWLGSADKPLKSITLTQDDFIKRLKSKVEEQGRTYQHRPFHQLCANEKSHVLAIAPTGAGKTEASLIWALGGKCHKIIFLMPTMVTSNSIYERLSTNYFDSDMCGLSHSGIQTYYALNIPQHDAFQLVQNKAFIPHVMVSTVDQMLSTGFNTGHWQFKEMALVGSHVIFDEIQAYDTYTIALITETIKKIVTLGGKVMIMSATMPKFLREHFAKLLSIEKPIIAHELMSRRSNKWCYLEKTINQLDDLIGEALDAGKKVALIINDVETVKEQYNKYKDKYRTMCLHSQFTMKDRTEKENILLSQNDIQLVIGTQVLEVSLDVSFEIMFSECAAIDSLIQRAGRCNRHGEYMGSCFYVFDYSEVSEVIYGENILKRTKEVILNQCGRLSEEEIGDMLESVYHDFNLCDEDYIRGQSIYSRVAYDFFICNLPMDEEQLKTRLFKYAKEVIIPIQFMDTVKEFVAQKKYAFIKLYEVPVSAKWYYQNKKNLYVENEMGLPIFCVDYRSDYGILVDNSSAEFI
ncbi:CRISPR-associated helicase Cas3' [Vallitalea pronyensis]|uniref:CRISPR-associated helicase Cas3 n=1 Tax=Vallitalea pronyensis TaxID=1348613 RepID=A0A8J8MM14_9FIRM|nr:CRISPR-associated helicase Cas3' [Vallitalea pronyensis]QUI23976.1 CRISPR-associated helicase Cas3' [Vallitalea pronyensis]